jgi:hypothetical protein
MVLVAEWYFQVAAQWDALVQAATRLDVPELQVDLAAVRLDALALPVPAERVRC